VIWAGYGLFYGNNNPDDPYGLAVSIQHNFGHQGKRLYSVYAHLDQIHVVTGQQVEAGDQVGTVGTTGSTTGPHLHFEVRIHANNFFATRNPELWLVPPQGWGVLVGRLMNSNGSLLTNHTMYVRSLETKQRWQIISYGSQTVNSDDYYRENLALSDLPSGEYQITLEYLEDEFSTEISIHPGAISYFTFRGKQGFDHSPPPGEAEAAWYRPIDP
ncbi:MAG: peptidoglycan DD-metalloendopeptidase family protein, partial [Anaerolineaceae bacterium]|nr:peptidoglycan DD-metalloendopeptidase family protein [Anaerolineaceae bacterium]